MKTHKKTPFEARSILLTAQIICLHQRPQSPLHSDLSLWCPDVLKLPLQQQTAGVHTLTPAAEHTPVRTPNPHKHVIKFILFHFSTGHMTVGKT